MATFASDFDKHMSQEVFADMIDQINELIKRESWGIRFKTTEFQRTQYEKFYLLVEVKTDDQLTHVLPFDKRRDAICEIMAMVIDWQLYNPEE